MGQGTKDWGQRVENKGRGIGARNGERGTGKREWGQEMGEKRGKRAGKKGWGTADGQEGARRKEWGEEIWEKGPTDPTRIQGWMMWSKGHLSASLCPAWGCHTLHGGGGAEFYGVLWQLGGWQRPYGDTAWMNGGGGLEGRSWVLIRMC